MPVQATQAAAPSGKTLTEQQLAAAGLISSELPSGLGLVSDVWKPAVPEDDHAAGDPVCQPVIDLLFGTGKATAEVTNSYQGQDIIYPARMSLASYSPAQALSSFASVKEALRECTSISWKTPYGPMVHAKLTPASAPKLGDDSVGFSLTYQAAGPLIEIQNVFRVGACTFRASAMDSPNVPPKLSREVLSAQITKLKSSQDG